MIFQLPNLPSLRPYPVGEPKQSAGSDDPTESTAESTELFAFCEVSLHAGSSAWVWLQVHDVI